MHKFVTLDALISDGSSLKVIADCVLSTEKIFSSIWFLVGLLSLFRICGT